MSKAEVKYAEVRPVESVTLTLTLDEAEQLRVLLGRMRGSLLDYLFNDLADAIGDDALHRYECDPYTLRRIGA